jgi:hypothetical protein
MQHVKPSEDTHNKQQVCICIMKFQQSRQARNSMNPVLDWSMIACVRCWLLRVCRTGYESSAAAQAAAASSRSRGRSQGQYGNSSFFYSGPDEFDPEEIFNAFFG